MTFLDVWIGYTICGITLFSVVFIWAIRTRQFSNLDHGRHIPLNSPENLDRGPEQNVSLIDRYTWVGLTILTFGVILSALWIGYMH